jgi:DNA replication protein DnaC
LTQKLGLSDLAQGYESLAEQAAQKQLPYCDFLEQALECEYHARQERNIKVRTQLAGFPMSSVWNNSISSSRPPSTRRRFANWPVCVSSNAMKTYSC